MSRRISGAGQWSIPIERATRPTGSPKSAATLTFSPTWLLLDLPTAVLVAVFVGTGWLGYTQPGPAEVDAPTPALVVPTEPAPSPPR
ncbi:hypothetical protein [Nocardia wallacei]|uniref:hypothetical protein n=1 Tax=Nocardia wallacei TaxID=480035 RepID=UPI0024571E25|nr:hypothetical protein [Nocardia wallacei]